MTKDKNDNMTKGLRTNKNKTTQTVC